MEGRITTLENMIRNAKIIEESDLVSDAVSLGKSVTFVELPRWRRRNVYNSR